MDARNSGHAPAHTPAKPGRAFGTNDWVLPTILAVLFGGGLMLAMLTVGDNTVHLGVFFGFVVVVVWFLLGLFIGLVMPFLIFFGAAKIGPLNRFWGMTLCILAGLMYYIISFTWMAHH